MIQWGLRVGTLSVADRGGAENEASNAKVSTVR